MNRFHAKSVAPRRRRGRGIVLALLAATAVAASAQGVRRGYFQGGDPNDIQNTPYDGRFTFARIRYTPLYGGDGFRGGRDLKWDHDFPRAELNFTKILNAVSLIRPFLEGGNIFTLDDPELMKYPVAYLSEPGYWTLTDSEAAGLRNYLLKGGFLIVDDFPSEQWDNFEMQMRRVLPQARPVPLDPKHPIFDSFFHITSLEMYHPNFGQRSEFYGIFEGNDPAKRLMAVINYNNDIGEYWEYSDLGFFPIELSNEAYKLGVNYVVYAMTH